MVDDFDTATANAVELTQSTVYVIKIVKTCIEFRGNVE